MQAPFEYLFLNVSHSSVRCACVQIYFVKVTLFCLFVSFFFFSLFALSLQFNDSFSRTYDHGNSTTMVLNNCDEDGDYRRISLMEKGKLASR